MNLHFAFAVNKENQFEKKHFGDAEKYIIFKSKNKSLERVSEEINQFVSIEEKHNHGSIKKGREIIKFLKEKNVNVLVSKRFGANIKLINQHFIPVEISLSTPDEVIEIINKHIHRIEDEWEHNNSDYKLFNIKSGILKSRIKK